MQNNSSDKEIQARLAQQRNENQLLNAEIDRLNDMLIQINGKLEESEKFKTHFISNVTNELINPFTSIICLAQNILAADKQDWKKIISMVALIHSETFNLELQLKNILNAARLEAGLMYLLPEKTDITHIISALKDTFKHELLKRKIEIITQTNVDSLRNEKRFFNTDTEKLNIILSNLLDNAIKFSKDNSTIYINVNLLVDKIEISMADMGIGIPETEIENIFNRFTRLDNDINSVQPGQGLGLSITKGIIDLFEGEISVSENDYKGATFSISIPEQEKALEVYATNMNETFFDIDEVY